ncbi:GspH/FimT family pseudopilin [Motiliproteus sediminis]|uniref:GspH/FimT family pseudopilin n=1 Tax=Motiliproteus sediminis TaxID=1468178 RepID=UPI001AEFFC8E|nr:GspH/FimT family pseudopilin [Motiliproteus sediminis]
MGHRSVEKGFGLIELLVTLAVITMVISIGIPSYESFTKKNRAVSRLDEINSALRLARQVAIEHNFRARVCAKSGSGLNTNTCGNATDWNNGYLVQMESSAAYGSWDSNTLMNKSFASDNTQTAVAKTSTSTLLNQVVFNSTGNLDSASGPNVAITISLGGCTATTSINISGRISTTPLSGC